MDENYEKNSGPIGTYHIGLYIAVPLFSRYSPAAVATHLKNAELSKVKEMDNEAVKATKNVKKVIVCKRMGVDASLAGGRDTWWHEILSDQPMKRESE